MEVHSNQHLPAGTSVEVFSPFSHSWVGGFNVADNIEDSCTLRRRSDQTALPTTFHVDDLRAERQ
ncbi:MAG TPA: hypothetical protein VEM59_00340 [Acidimicrobiia bacterium]|nr:hypothetical protein [Acidimicrobiia bacterium]